MSYETDEVVSIGGWVGVMILMAIPIVNIITVLVLAFSDNANLKNFGRAMIILFLVLLVISILAQGCQML